jgi:hypothetical protein
LSSAAVPLSFPCPDVSVINNPSNGIFGTDREELCVPDFGRMVILGGAIGGTFIEATRWIQARIDRRVFSCTYETIDPNRTISYVTFTRVKIADPVLWSFGSCTRGGREGCRVELIDPLSRPSC